MMLSKSNKIWLELLKRQENMIKRYNGKKITSNYMSKS